MLLCTCLFFFILYCRQLGSMRNKHDHLSDGWWYGDKIKITLLSMAITLPPETLIRLLMKQKRALCRICLWITLATYLTVCATMVIFYTARGTFASMSGSAAAGGNTSSVPAAATAVFNLTNTSTCGLDESVDFSSEVGEMFFITIALWACVSRPFSIGAHFMVQRWWDSKHTKGGLDKGLEKRSLSKSNDHTTLRSNPSSGFELQSVMPTSQKRETGEETEGGGGGDGLGGQCCHVCGLGLCVELSLCGGVETVGDLVGHRRLPSEVVGRRRLVSSTPSSTEGKAEEAGMVVITDPASLGVSL